VFVMPVSKICIALIPARAGGSPDSFQARCTGSAFSSRRRSRQYSGLTVPHTLATPTPW
jgi:hypothetical protein